MPGLRRRWELVVKKSGQPRKAKPKKTSPQPPGASRSATPKLRALQPFEQQLGSAIKDRLSEPSYKLLCQEHPIEAKLELAYLEGGHQCLKLKVQRLGMNSDSEWLQQERLRQKIRQLDSDARELGSWIRKYVRPMPPDQLNELLSFMGRCSGSLIVMTTGIYRMQ